MPVSTQRAPDDLDLAHQLHQVIGGLGVDDLDARQVDDHEARLRARHLAEQALDHVAVRRESTTPMMGITRTSSHTSRIGFDSSSIE